MPTSCVAWGCAERFVKGNGIGFFIFPRDEERKNAWIRAIRREKWIPSKGSRICSKHFQTGKPNMDKNHPDYVPNVFSFTNISLSASADIYEERKTRRENRESKQNTARQSAIVQSDSISMDDDDISTTDYEEQEALSILMPSQTDLNDSENEISLLRKEKEMLLNEIQALREENEELKKLLDKRDGVQNILKDNRRLQFYTGLPSVELFDWIISLFDAISSNVKIISNRIQILIVLMKLKLNLFQSDIAYRFHISSKTVSKIFNFWLPKLSKKLGPLINWSSKKALKRNLPTCFKNSEFKNSTCIIDCTEVPIQRPNSHVARSQTWSNYKHGHTVKFLVGTTPSGSISFVSDAWGGKVSDKEITIRSGFLDKIDPGDTVLADRGFLLQDEFAAQNAKLIVPAFKKSKKQLLQHELLTSKKISNVRIHVERVIKQIKRFHILQSKIPITILKYVNDIIITCGALSNLSLPIVK